MLQVWKKINMCINSIVSHRQMLNNRKLTLHQRVTYANSCMLSKIWYLCHIYPLTPNFAKQINVIIIRYVWNGKYEPIRRITVFRPKQEGGLGLVNCLIKSKVILANSWGKMQQAIVIIVQGTGNIPHFTCFINAKPLIHYSFGYSEYYLKYVTSKQHPIFDFCILTMSMEIYIKSIYVIFLSISIL